jgi:general secretion pathway protein A
MYLRFFGLQQSPFSIAPDPRFLFMSESHREALAHLQYGLDGGGGFVVLTGEIGAGKTTVCRCLLEQIPKQCKLAYLFNPKLTVRELLQSICIDFAIPNPRAEANTASIKDYIDALNAHLLASHAAGQHNVLIIDEAQSLSADVLEQLRLLTNLETNERKLLQIVLIGQPELRDMLARPELEQVAQRVVARYHLGTLSRQETDQYIDHRLSVAGIKTRNPFDHKARQRIYKLSGGVPRRINLLCDRALLGAYAEGTRRVRRGIVDKAAQEVFGAAGSPARGKRPIWLRWAWAAGGMAGLALAAGLAGLARNGRPGHSAASAASATALDKASVAASGAVLPDAGGMAASAASAAPSDSAASAQLAGAAGAGAKAAPPWASAGDLVQALAPLTGDEAQAWRDLAPGWTPAPLAGEPCQAVRAQRLRCIKRRGSLDLLRQIDRPAILPLYSTDGQTHFVQLIGLGEHSITLRLGERLVRATPETIAPLWRGELGTLWRVPAGVRVDADGLNASADGGWLAKQLGLANGSASPVAPSGESLRAAVREFQRTRGLLADGVAGPVTLMALHRVIGSDEPQLQR